MRAHAILKKLMPKRLKEFLKEEVAGDAGIPSVAWSLRNMQRLGFQPSSVLDVGAYVGEWSSMALNIFPKASFLMLEAQESKRTVLGAITDEHANFKYRIAVVGAKRSEGIVFYEDKESPTGSSLLASLKDKPVQKRICTMETLDDILKEESFAPDLIKLDIQGYELEALKGGAQALKKAEAVLMEISLIEFNIGNPLLHEVIDFMFERGFRAYDIPALLRRPLDKALVQMDIIFVKETSRLLENKAYE